MNKNIFWIAGVVALSATLAATWHFYGRAWYRDHHAGESIRNVFAAAGVRDFYEGDNIDILNREAMATDEVMELSRTLGPDAIPSLVRVVVDKNAGGLARNWAEVAIHQMNPPPPAHPDADYSGLLRVAADKTDSPGDRASVIRMLGRWKYSAAEPIFQAIINDPSDDTGVRDVVIEQLGNVGGSTEVNIAAVMASGSYEEKAKWMRYAEHAELTDSQIFELSEYIWDKKDAPNIAARAIAGQKSPLATKILGEAYLAIAKGERHAFSDRLIAKLLVQRGDVESWTYLKKAIDVASTKHDLEAIVDVIRAAQFHKHKYTGEMIEHARQRIREASGDIEEFEDWMKSPYGGGK